MAENKTALGLEVPGQVINSYKDLKNAVKAAKDEQVKASEQFGISSAEYKKAAKNVADLNDKMEDLGDSSRSLKGSGLERSAQGFSQLGEGLRNLDFDKVKVGLTAIKSALAATGIMLIVQGVMYLIENFDELSKGSGILAKALRFVGDIVTAVVDSIYALTDAIGLTNSSLDKMGEAIAENANKANEALAAQTKEFDRQMKAAKLAGQSTLELEQAKQQAIIDTNKLIVEQIIAFVRAGGELDAEKRKQLTASLDFIKDARLEQKIIEVNHNKEVNKEYEKSLLERKALSDKDFEDYKKSYKDMDDYRRKINDDYAASLHQQALDDRKRLETKSEEEQAFGEADLNASLERVNKESKAKKWSEEDYRNTINGTLQVAQQSFETQAQLVNFLFDLKRSRGIKGSAEDLKLAKRQFQINKALAIQSSIISGIQGVINALSAQSVIPEPFGTILKVATAVGVGIAATVNTAKIASQQFNEGGGGGGGDATASTGNIGSSATAAPPSLATPQNTPPKTTAFDDNGKNQSLVIKAEVVETESTEAQKRVARFQDQATF